MLPIVRPSKFVCLPHLIWYIMGERFGILWEKDTRVFEDLELESLDVAYQIGPSGLRALSTELSVHY